MPVIMPALGESLPYMSYGRERRELEKIRAGIDQRIDAFARGEFAARAMLCGGIGAAAGARSKQPLAQLVAEGHHALGIAREAFAVPVEAGFKKAHEGRDSRLLALNPSLMTFGRLPSLQ